MQYGIYKPCTCFCEHFYFMIFFYSISSRFSIQFSESKNHADVKTAETITMIDWVIDSQRRTHRNLMGLHHHAWRHRLRERHCFAVFYYESSPVQENNAAWETTQLRPVWSLLQSAEGQQKSTASLNVANCEIEGVDSFTYLGANVTKDGRVTADIRKKIAMAGPSFRRLDSIWRVNNINRKVKVSLYKSLLLSVLFYG